MILTGIILIVTGVILSIPVVMSHHTSTEAENITGVMLPSCSKHYAGSYYYHNETYLNHCPNCGANNTLTENPKGTYEGEFTCNMRLGGCDSDFCICGKEKMHYSSVHLKWINTTKN
jgi:hypothetical protein